MYLYILMEIHVSLHDIELHFPSDLHAYDNYMTSRCTYVLHSCPYVLHCCPYVLHSCPYVLHAHMSYTAAHISYTAAAASVNILSQSKSFFTVCCRVRVGKPLV